MHSVDSTNFEPNEFESIEIDLITGQTCRCYWIQISTSSSSKRLLNSMLQVIQFMLIWFPNKGRVAPAKKIVQYQGDARDANSTPCRNSHPQIFLHMSLKDHLAQFHGHNPWPLFPTKSILQINTWIYYKLRLEHASQQLVKDEISKISTATTEILQREITSTCKQ
jgi:hypothetical protein